MNELVSCETLKDKVLCVIRNSPETVSNLSKILKKSKGEIHGALATLTKEHPSITQTEPGFVYDSKYIKMEFKNGF